MKLSVTQESLAKALGTVGRVVNTRGSLPVLSNILLNADSNRLRLAVTNLEVGINYWIGCKVEQKGAITAPARLLSEFISSLPAGNISLSASESNLTVKAPHHESLINGISADEFPLIPEVKTDPIFKLKAEDFREAVSQVVVAASVDENRPVFAGVNMFIDGGTELVLAATDSYRLAERRIKIPKTKAELSVIVPARTMQELVRILADSSGDVSMHVSENQALFKAEDIELVSRLIEGQFPNYQQLIPSKDETTVVIETAELSRITKMASLFARENAGSIRIEVQAEGELRIMSSASQVGENTSSVECEVSGDDGEVSLNARYLSDALAVIKTENVIFGISGRLNPCLLRPEGKDSGDNYLHIIMPLRT